METTIRIYISGAITGIKDYEKKFMDAEKYLSRDCIHIENPVRIGSGLKNPTYEDYMRADLKALLTCDEIYMLHGWMEAAAEQSASRADGAGQQEDRYSPLRETR